MNTRWQAPDEGELKPLSKAGHLTFRKFTWLHFVQLTLLTSMLFWIIALAAFYYRVVFTPPVGHHITLLQATRFLLKRGLPFLLKLALIDLIGSAFLWILSLALWGRITDSLSRMAKGPEAVLDATPNVWPPPPTISASTDTLPRT